MAKLKAVAVAVEAYMKGEEGRREKSVATTALMDFMCHKGKKLTCSVILQQCNG